MLQSIQTKKRWEIGECLDPPTHPHLHSLFVPSPTKGHSRETFLTGWRGREGRSGKRWSPSPFLPVVSKSFSHVEDDCQEPGSPRREGRGGQSFFWSTSSSSLPSPKKMYRGTDLSLRPFPFFVISWNGRGVCQRGRKQRGGEAFSAPLPSFIFSSPLFLLLSLPPTKLLLLSPFFASASLALPRAPKKAESPRVRIQAKKISST